MSPAGVARRFVALSALRWFPVGLVVPILVLSLQARGLDLPAIGRLMALFATVTLVLELPTGGLSDVIGRRWVLIAGSVSSASGAAALAVATAMPGLALGIVLLAVGRALGSGPLESWYVDTVRDEDPGADISRGLSHGQAADSIGLGVGSLVGGAAPALAAAVWPDLPTTGDTVLITFSAPLLGAAMLFATHAVAVLALVREPERDRIGVTSLVGAVGDTLREGFGLTRSSRTLRRLIGYAAVLGVVLGGVELVAPGAFASMLGGGEKGSAAYGVLVGTGFGVSALGAAIAPTVARRLGATVRAVRLLAVLTVPSVLLIGLPWFGGAAVMYVLLYLVLGVNGPLLATLLHDGVTAAARNTMLSMEALALEFGAVGTSVAVGALVGATSAAAGFAAIAVVAGLGVLVVWGVEG